MQQATVMNYSGDDNDGDGNDDEDDDHLGKSS